MALTRRRTDTAIQALHFNEHSDDPYTRAGLLLDYSRVLLKYIISKRYTLQAICLILKYLLKSMLYHSSKPHCLFPFYMSFPNFAQRNATQRNNASFSTKFDYISFSYSAQAFKRSASLINQLHWLSGKRLRSVF